MNRGRTLRMSDTKGDTEGSGFFSLMDFIASFMIPRKCRATWELRSDNTVGSRFTTKMASI